MQAQVEGVSGVWKGLTDNVNQLAGTLTTQLRAISEVSTAVTQGDLTRSIAVDARGEVAELKDNINEMIRNLAETTRRQRGAGLAQLQPRALHRMMQGQRDLETVSRMINVRARLPASSARTHGAFFIAQGEDENVELQLISSYAYKRRKTVANRFTPGDGLVGQAALEKTAIHLTRRRPTTSASRPASGKARRTTSSSCRRCSGLGDGRDRARVVPAVQRDATRRSSTS